MDRSAITRRNFLKVLGGAAAAAALPAAPWAAEPIGAGGASPRRPNVLFIAVDDLRPQLGCYGRKQIVSPNINRLAAEGLLFERTYCQQAICMASRASLMSGYRPDKGGIFNCGPLYECVPGALSLNRHFLANGYETASIGKVYHHRSDETVGWSRGAYHPMGQWVGRGYLAGESIAEVKAYARAHPKETRTGMGPAFEGPDVADNAYADGMHADRAVALLGELKDRPFFLAVGFLKPHLPFCAPKKYWDLYAEDKIDLADNPFVPKGAPKIALTDWGELRGYAGMPAKGDMPDDLARKLIHGYYACVSYTDAQIGRLLDELDRLGLRDNTIVVLWGDHGWKLGEHTMWCKHTNYELDTHAPLIISAPGAKARGRSTRALTEFVDIYPTLCDLCGLERPAHLEGASMAPLFDDPDRPWKRAAFSQYPRGRIMGYTMRTDRFRYTEWRNMQTGATVATELYDHASDPAENTNVAHDPARAGDVAARKEMLRAGYKAARPPGA
ncbi:MAG: sulfatase [bacterium]|nr:sulfatase [bacterium]